MNDTGMAPPARLFEMLDGAPDDATMLMAGDRAVTYGRMRRDSACLAARLKRLGLARGDRLAVWLPNIPEWLTVAFACSRLGVAVAPLNVRLGSQEVGFLLSRAACKAILLAPAQRNGACVEALRGVPPEDRSALRLVVTLGGTEETILDGVRQTSFDALLADPEPDEKADAEVADGQPGDVSLILATSGTTSAPKLVQHTQERNVRHAGDAAAAVGLNEPGTSLLLGIPMCGAFGYTLAITTIRARKPLVLMEAFVPEEAARLLAAHGITHMLGTDDMLDKILSVVPEGKPFPALRMFGHANFTPALTAILPPKAEAHGVLLRGFFGMTETLAMFAAQPADAPLERRSQGGGRPVSPQAVVRVRDPESGALLPDGEIGEVEVRTPNAMIGYMNNPQATAEVFTDDGFLKTGDYGLRLPDGGMIFVSRIKDVLRIAGYLVSPTEIEEVILALPGVTVCQTVSASCPAGVRPVAFVVMEPGHGLDEAAALAACRARLAVYKVPARVFAIDAMPVTDGPNGAKVKKNVLRDLATEWMNPQAAAAGAGAAR
ncbi:AMP-binding protein [Azospirillum doebereinerae]|uniref:Acyl-CoA synthetase n=1 Tax=Azospirillum doebereinerae TaxID=92933 RepID=A0A3S0WXW8_9PROT|nr:AMP-binding protein [Azospirillum doebereinerae]RUQ75574.1 acyl-CoA synthetase [Azospirillum doebereinerae]